MTCRRCQHQTCKKFGYFGKRRVQRWRCASHNSTFCESVAKLGTHYAAPTTATHALSMMLVERSNLSLRMHLCRFTRLTNAYSKKLENLKAAVTLYFAWYNFVRVNQAHRVTPTMEEGLTDHVWSLDELSGAA